MSEVNEGDKAKKKQVVPTLVQDGGEISEYGEGDAGNGNGNMGVGGDKYDAMGIKELHKSKDVTDSQVNQKSTKDLATPTPNRSVFLGHLKSEFTPPVDESTEQFPKYRNYLTDDSLDSVMPAPTPVGLRSPMIERESPLKSPRIDISRVDSRESRSDSRPDSSSSSPRTPKVRSPHLSPNITPITSNEDYVIYSDSDNASQSSIDLKDKPRRRVKRDDSVKPKKRLRRKSNKSDTSVLGTGYTSIPGTGKIFRNLLILEESLRQQVIQQRALRRKYLIFLTILSLLIITVSHHLFLTKYTSTGTTRVLLQLTLLALLMTLFLYHLSGEYQKTIVLPRKFLSTTNKGLRQLNIRLVKIVTPWTDSFTDLIREILLYIIAGCLNAFHKVSEKSIKNKNSKIEVFLVSCQSQCQPRIGVTDVKLVLNTRVFNTDIREGWELYRSEFWINEGVRRRQQMMAFVNEESPKEILARSKLLKKDKKERRERKKSNPPKLNEMNLESLTNGLASNESIPE